MLSRLSRTRLAGIVVAAVLAAALAAKAAFAFPFQFGIDFYQFWGVPIAHRTAVAASPYLDPPGYERALNGIADASDNAKLKRANAFRRTLETMATPFFYSAFALVSPDYETAQIVPYVAALSRHSDRRGGPRHGFEASSLIAIGVPRTLRGAHLQTRSCRISSTET